MSKPLPSSLFKSIPEDERQEWKDWARENYNSGDAIDPCWHPLVRAECEIMNVEAWERSQ